MQLTVPLQRSFQPPKALRIKNGFSPSVFGRAIATWTLVDLIVAVCVHLLTHPSLGGRSQRSGCDRADGSTELSTHPSLGGRSQPKTHSRIIIRHVSFNPPISGRAIATPSARILVLQAFQVKFWQTCLNPLFSCITNTPLVITRVVKVALTARFWTLANLPGF